MKSIILIISMATTGMVAFSQSSVSAAFSKSYTYEASKEYSKAASAIDAVYDASSYSMNLRLGWLNYLAGEYVKSQGFYKKSIELEAKSIEARLGYVYPTAAMENWDDVVKTYNEILAIDSHHAVVNYRMAYIYFVRKDFEKAVNYALKVADLYPFDYDSNYLLGQIYVSQGKIKEAKMYLTRALNYNPSSTEVKTLLDKI